jgi:drug/metabolite transporter (DMT)-like permease
MFAIVSILIPQIAFAAGLKYLNASTASIISVMEPVIAIVAAFLILGESLSVIQMFGGLMVLLAVGLLQARPMIMRKMMKVE